MSWKECQDLAVKNNTSLKTSEYSYKSASYSFKASHLKILPDLNLDADYTYLLENDDRGVIVREFFFFF